jgi:hypothetical protein
MNTVVYAILMVLLLVLGLFVALASQDMYLVCAWLGLYVAVLVLEQHAPIRWF